jgi:hypothetical protein
MKLVDRIDLWLNTPFIGNDAYTELLRTDMRTEEGLAKGMVLMAVLKLDAKPELVDTAIEFYKKKTATLGQGNANEYLIIRSYLRILQDHKNKREEL